MRDDPPITMAAWWQFKDYQTRRGDIPIRRWYREQPASVRAAFDLKIQQLSVTEMWTTRSGVKALVKDHVGLHELIIDVDERMPKARRATKRRFRPVGVHVQERREFVLLLGCEKRGNDLIPSDAFDRALKLMNEWRRGFGVAHEHEI